MKDNWQELGELVAHDDGLPTRDSGPWAEDKLWLWNRYISITTSAMVDNPKWPAGLCYVDLFAGPGVCTIRDSGKRIPGSPLIAANAPKPFRKIVLCDLSPEYIRACRMRLSECGAASRTVFLQGDCNQLADEVVRAVPDRSLAVVFIDPTGLDVHFSTIERIAQDRRADFLLLFADAVDLVRNVRRYEALEHSKLDKMFGDGSRWREEFHALDNHEGESIRLMFSRLLKRQVSERLGYAGFREKAIKGPHGLLYTLIFASKHERGLEFWDKIAGKDRHGQGDLF